jgi:hypothetical protein
MRAWGTLMVPHGFFHLVSKPNRTEGRTWYEFRRIRREARDSS